MSFRKPEKVSALDQWQNFRIKVSQSDDEQSKLMIKLAEEWILMNREQRAEAYRIWNDYYEVCAVSEQAAIFHELRLALNKKNSQTVSSIRQKLEYQRSDMPLIKPPTIINPYLVTYNQTSQTYLRLTYAAKKEQNERVRQN